MARFPRITSLPYLGLTCGLGNSQKDKFRTTPDFFLSAATTGHIARFKVTREPHTTRGRSRRILMGIFLYKKARASIPEADNIQERAPQGLQKTPHSRTFRLLIAAAAKSLQSCPTLCDPSPPGSPVPGILQARTLGWVAISFSNA